MREIPFESYFDEITVRSSQNHDLATAIVKSQMLDLVLELELNRLIAEKSTRRPFDLKDELQISDSLLHDLTANCIGGAINRDCITKLFDHMMRELEYGFAGESRAVEEPRCDRCCQHPLCSFKGDKLQKDHILPFHLTRISEDWNVQWLCADHNRRKSDSLRLFPLYSQEDFSKGFRDKFC